MTFDALERSVDAGQPIRLYEFAYGQGAWRYCSADRNIVTATQTWLYVPGGITDGGIRQSGDASSDALTIEGPSDLPVVQLFRALPPTNEVVVTVRSLHYGDAEARVTWVGSMAEAKRRGVDRVEITCESLLASMSRGGLSLGWERSCPYATYDHNCLVNRELFKTSGTLLTVSGSTVEAAAFGAHPDGWFTGGFIEWVSADGVVERRFIQSHAGPVLTLLLSGTHGLSVGLAVDAFAGDDRSAQTCLDKFNNLDNHGGIGSLPGSSPFDGELVF